MMCSMSLRLFCFFERVFDASLNLNRNIYENERGRNVANDVAMKELNKKFKKMETKEKTNTEKG